MFDERGDPRLPEAGPQDPAEIYWSMVASRDGVGRIQPEDILG
ncbi:hypothetical protein [Marinactinospora rubrisoli]|uniref:Uncharacterized protein n=1 Tax=Marinactinospora rubrisoli TaxID=2715399 RepID=A0ABW2KI68_9ACTN